MQCNHEGAWKRKRRAGGSESGWRCDDGSRGWSDVRLCAMQVASKTWKRQENESPLEPREGMQSCRPTSEPQSCKKTHLCCNKPLTLWSIVTAAKGD